MINYSNKINEQYSNEIKKYLYNPCSPCSNSKAIILLKRFENKDYYDFLQDPIEEYLPALSEGTMKIREKLYNHDDALTDANELIKKIDEKQLAQDFLLNEKDQEAPANIRADFAYPVYNSKRQFSKKYIQ